MYKECKANKNIKNEASINICHQFFFFFLDWTTKSKVSLALILKVKEKKEVRHVCWLSGWMWCIHTVHISCTCYFHSFYLLTWRVEQETLTSYCLGRSLAVWACQSFPLVLFNSVTQLCLTLCDCMNHNTPGFPVHHQLPEFSNPCPLSRWCHPTISSSVIPFSSCPQSFPASGSFQMSQLFASGSKSTGVSPLSWPQFISLKCLITDLCQVCLRFLTWIVSLI